MDFKTLTIIMFQNRREWVHVQDKDKESIFFIFNRYMAKNMPKQANQFNQKGIDRATAMDVWMKFLKNVSRTPEWFWKGPTKKKDPSIKDWQLLQEWHGMRVDDIYIMCDLFPKDVKAEIARIQEVKKEMEI